ncbi:MAG: hypothetical protein QXI91_07595 [Candidatus Bathyarchaeia archaeon]
MLIGVLFMVLSTFFGMAVSAFLKIAFTSEERLCFSVLVGNAASTIIVYLLSLWQEKLDLLSIVLGMVFIALASFFIVNREKISFKEFVNKNLNLENVFVVLFGAAAFLVLNFKCVLMEEFGSFYGSWFVFADYSFHISVINSFVYRDNFPPQYPIMANVPMNYPSLMDFLSAILMKVGFDLRSSIIIPNVLFQAATLCLLASLATRLVKRKFVGVLSALLFFFAGNMGIIYAVEDIAEHGGFINWITNLPTDYSGSGVSPLPGMRFGNPVTVMLMPQRPSMLGIGISLIVYILVLYALQNEGSTRELIIAGVLAGLLPSIHSHSFIAVSIVLFLLPILFRKDLRFFVHLFVPAVVLALPQILIIQTQVKGGFMGFTLGWLEENAWRIRALDWNTPLGVFSSTFESISILTWFWFMNLGLIILPFIFGFLKSDKIVKRFCLPYLMLFFLGNFVRFQPWDWDNYKIFLHWYILMVIIASYGIIEITKFSLENLKSAFKIPKLETCLKATVGFATLAIILFFSTATGFLSHTRVLQENYLMWSKADVTFAQWIRENTPPESIFLTSTDFHHPIVTLAGRQIVLGYEGWLWSHGIDGSQIQRVRQDVIEMFNGNYTLIKEHGVNFISVTDYERIQFTINIEFFSNSGYFEEIYNETLDGRNYVIFKVL